MAKIDGEKMQRTLVILKPDCVARGLIGEVVGRFERRGLRIVAMKMLKPGKKLIHDHYREHVKKPFFPALYEYITSGAMAVMVIEGKNAIELTRMMMGATDCAKAAPGTIRGDLGKSMRMNIIHGSDCEKSARREIAVWFKPAEIIKTSVEDYRHILAFEEGRPL